MPGTGPSEPTDAVAVTVTLEAELTQRDAVRLGIAFNTDTPIRQAQPPRYDGGNCPFCGRGSVSMKNCGHNSGGPA